MFRALMSSSLPVLLAVLAQVAVSRSASSAGVPPEAMAVIEKSIESGSADYWRRALEIWEWAEPGYQETRSSAALASMLEEAGFTVETGVAGMPTAFVASFGSGSPTIGLLAEFDALPGFSQEASPTKAPRHGRTWGHACGHHLFGVGSVGAAIAVADAIRAGAIDGTVKLYGTPAEEGGGAKTYMVREGLFEGVDTVLHWHCSSRNRAGDPTNQARIAAKFRFHGKSAHAAAAPEEGRSALDGVDVMNYAAELLREHTPDLTRIHRVITSGGSAPNVVPDFAEVYYYVRHPDPEVAQEVFDRVVKCAEAGALATGTRLEVEHLGGTYSILPNDTLAEVSLRNLTELNDLAYDDEERRFAIELQRSLSEPESLDSLTEVEDSRGETTAGSTDVGDVSWTVPTTGVSVSCWVPGTPAHSWQAVAAGGTTIGRKGMVLASRTLAATAAELMSDPELIARAKQELEERLGATPYRPMLEPGQQPPLDYRDPATPREDRP